MCAQRNEKKVVSRNVAIVLGIISVIFLVGLVGAILNYTSIISGKDNDIQTLTNQKNQLQTWLQGNKSQIAGENAEIQTLINQKNQLQRWLQGNNSIANLANSTIWVDSKNVSIQANNAWNSTPFTANYAGYISVQVGNLSTTGTFYVRATYSSHGVNYDNSIYVGISGTAVFPVLPASIQIRVENPGATVANATVTITYYY